MVLLRLLSLIQEANLPSPKSIANLAVGNRNLAVSAAKKEIPTDFFAVRNPIELFFNSITKYDLMIKWRVCANDHLRNRASKKALKIHQFFRASEIM
jgi:hypothetical protein